jgi:hypothetical protein
MIKYFVRTTKERDFNYDLDYEIILDTEHKPVQSFIRSLYLMNDTDSVLLEDDLVLCKNFKEEIEKVIAQYPNNIINFFTRPDFYFTSHFSDIFSYNQCTYFPKGISSILAKDIEEHINNYTRYYGVALNDTLVRLHIPHLIYRPCLVQHIDGKSILNSDMDRVYYRNTIYFKDYLDKLGIDMVQAYSKENKDKLFKMLEEDRIKWYKNMIQEGKEE